MVAVVVVAVFVQPVDVPLGPGAGDALAAHLAADAVLVGGVQKHRKHPRLVTQHKVRRAADTDVAFLVQQAAQHLGLVGKQRPVGQEVAAFGRDVGAVVDAAGHLVQKPPAGILVRVGKQRLVDAAVLAGKAQQLAVVEIDAVVGGDPAADVAAAAAAASAGDGNGKILLAHLVPSFAAGHWPR